MDTQNTMLLGAIEFKQERIQPWKDERYQMSKTLNELQKEYVEFLEEREWEQFHTPQNVAQAISVEAGELLELFLWHDNLGNERITNDDDFVSEVRMELADILIYSMSMAHQLDMDLTKAVDEKLERNHDRFDDERTEEINRETRRWQR